MPSRENMPPLQDRDKAKHRLYIIFRIHLGSDYRGNEKLPVIALDPNPDALTITHTMIENKTQMYEGFYEETWGETIGMISGNGVTRGFYFPAYGYVSGDMIYKTGAYYRYRELVEVFKNNGVVYDDKGSVFHQGRVQLEYDGVIYYGKFTNFRTTMEAPHQYHIGFSFEFNQRIG